MDVYADMVDGSLLVTVSEAARLLSASRPIVQRLIDAGELPIVWIDSKKRIRRSDVVALIDRRLEGAGATP
jgi:excisionase family DNA binding protein